MSRLTALQGRIGLAAVKRGLPARMSADPVATGSSRMIVWLLAGAVCWIPGGRGLSRTLGDSLGDAHVTSDNVTPVSYVLNRFVLRKAWASLGRLAGHNYQFSGRWECKYSARGSPSRSRPSRHRARRDR